MIGNYISCHTSIDESAGPSKEKGFLESWTNLHFFYRIECGYLDLSHLMRLMNSSERVRGWSLSWYKKLMASRNQGQWFFFWDVFCAKDYDYGEYG